MGQRSDSDQLRDAWRALAGEPCAGENGWRTIPVGAGMRPVRAGRRFPEDTEALLVGFRGVRQAPVSDLPKARGFSLAFTELAAPSPGLTWLALTREEAASLELFSAMVEDLLGALARAGTADERSVLRMFLDRISAWQAFMQHDGPAALSAEAELGLFGELTFLAMLQDSGVAPRTAVLSWRGPIGAPQDFVFEKGSVEVKSTQRVGTFPASISSLDQLDDSLAPPLYLAALRFRIGAEGRTLSTLIGELRHAYAEDFEAVTEFDSRLLRAGIGPRHAKEGDRHFMLIEHRFLPVQAGFPRLTRASVPLSLTKATYELDIDQIPAPVVGLEALVSTIGGL